MTFDLEQLGSTGFQDLASALAIATFGPGVTAMGRGRDGGRDMYCRGPIRWSNGDGEAADWSGYTVFQVKHKERLDTHPAADASWLWTQIRKDLSDWADPRGDRVEVPDNFVIVTNVRLTPVPDVGGHDSVLASISNFVESFADTTRDVSRDAQVDREERLRRLRSIQNWRIWDGNQIDSLLRVHGSVRNAFPGFLTGADVFAGLASLTDSVAPAELESVLRDHARAALVGESVLHFDEAGSADGSGIPIHSVAIDLPVTTSRGRSSVIREVLDRGEHIFKSSLTLHSGPRHLVVTGAPGNGKTTISKFLVQVYRAAMLNGAAQLSTGHQSEIDGTIAALGRFGVSLPRNRRWAMRIDLAEYAQEGGLVDDSTLLKWIAHKVSRRSNSGNVTAATLDSWMRRWPWFIVLDGLDEVTESVTRKRLINRVTEFVNDVEAAECDVFVVLTTRPVGYTENISPSHFERIDLDYLEPSEAVEYGIRATDVRLRGEVERIDRIVRLLHEAAENDAMHNLLRTPLQVLILTIIAESTGHFAFERFGLFWGYYETVFNRERTKPGGLHNLLRDHADQIRALHEQVGYELQVLSEGTEHAYATLSLAELKQVAWTVLEGSGHSPADVDSGLLDALVTAATNRLVLISPRGNDDGYGFDVRSLQELMAARHITSAPIEQVVRRLAVCAPSPHWRNTWLFAAGRYFAEPHAHHRDAIVDLVESFDRSDAALHRLGPISPVAPRLALAMLDDGMVRALPRWRDRLLSVGLGVLWEPWSGDEPVFAQILLRFADSGEAQHAAIADGLRAALASTKISRLTAQTVQGLIPGLVHQGTSTMRGMGLASVLATSTAALPSFGSTEGWERFEIEAATFPIEAEYESEFRDCIVILGRTHATGRISEDDAIVLVESFTQVAVARGVIAALANVVGEEVTLIQAIRDSVLPLTDRAPVGHRIAVA